MITCSRPSAHVAVAALSLDRFHLLLTFARVTGRARAATTMSLHPSSAAAVAPSNQDLRNCRQVFAPVTGRALAVTTMSLHRSATAVVGSPSLALRLTRYDSNMSITPSTSQRDPILAPSWNMTTTDSIFSFHPYTPLYLGFNFTLLYHSGLWLLRGATWRLAVSDVQCQRFCIQVLVLQVRNQAGFIVHEGFGLTDSIARQNKWRDSVEMDSVRNSER